MVVGIGAGEHVGFLLGEELDSLVRFEVELHPRPLALCVHELVGVRAKSVLVPPRFGIPRSPSSQVT